MFGAIFESSGLTVTAGEGAKTVYELDELFSTEGLEFALVYDDGKTVSITKDDLTKEPIYDFSTSGDKQVTFEFDGISATLDVKVNELDLPDTKDSSTKKPPAGDDKGSPVVVIVIVVVAVLVVGGVVAFVVLKKKKK